MNYETFYKTTIDPTIFHVYSVPEDNACFYRSLAHSILMAILIQLIFYSVSFLIGKSLGLNQIKIYHYIILLPPIWIITLLPISIGGFGVREGLYGVFFMPLGVTLEQSTLLSIFSLLPYLMLGMIGSVFYLLKKNTDKNLNLIF